MTDLANENPQEYPKGTPTLDRDEAATLSAEVVEWELSDKNLQRSFEFKDFNEAMGFVNRVALLAESQSHHPDFSISWNRVDLTFWTHTADGLTRNDFIMAAKVDRLLGG